jgi:DNA-binding transcriptional MerR regulator
MNASALLHSPNFEADASSPEMLTIGEVSRLYGVTLRALRFYEQRGLLKPIRRGGARFYDGVQKVRLQMILKGKHLGFTLTEITELLEAEQEHGVAKGGDFTLDEKMVLSQLRHLEERRADLDQAITELRAVHQKLISAA